MLVTGGDSVGVSDTRTIWPKEPPVAVRLPNFNQITAQILRKFSGAQPPDSQLGRVRLQPVTSIQVYFWGERQRAEGPEGVGRVRLPSVGVRGNTPEFFLIFHANQATPKAPKCTHWCFWRCLGRKDLPPVFWLGASAPCIPHGSTPLATVPPRFLPLDFFTPIYYFGTPGTGRIAVFDVITAKITKRHAKLTYMYGNNTV